MNKKQILACLSPCLVAAAAWADESQPIDLDPIVVVASKAPQPLSRVAGQVSVIGAREIEVNLVENLDDLFRYEPGVEAETSGTRFGQSGISIRGIGGNRVAMEIDGVPVRKGFAVGSYSNAGRALVDTDRVKQLEILHGPASSLYGSDALGGVLAFTTWDPDDLLARGGGDHYLAARGGIASADQSRMASGLGAWANDRHGLLVSATLRTGQELDSAATSSADQDLQDWDSSNYAARYTFDTAGGDRLRLSAEQYRRDTLTNVTSLLGQGRFRSTTGLVGDDQEQRNMLLVDYEFSGAWFERGVVRAFRTESETRNLTHEERAAATVPVRMRRDFHFDSDLSGAELNLFHTLLAGSSEHRLAAGIEFLRTEVSELRDGYQQNIASGDISHTILGEEMPVRDFPNSRTDEWGLFVQDEISLGKGAWQLIPAFRYTRYSLDPSSDPIYEGDYPDTPLVSIDEDQVSPRLALMYHFNDDWSVYGQYVQGFRAPPVEDANIGFDIALFKFRAIPNPELESETSRGYELGVRHNRPDSRFSLTWFDTDYDNFIDSRALVGFDPASGYLIFQSRNIDKARIYGLDLRFDQDLGSWSSALENWTLNTAAYWSRGHNDENDQPLNTVSPPQAVVGLNWASESGAWDVGINGTFTARQDDIDETGGERFQPDSYALLDLTGGWRINQHFSLRAGVFNLGDETYWRWSDVSRLAANDPMIPLLARPGRNYSITARFGW